MQWARHVSHIRFTPKIVAAIEGLFEFRLYESSPMYPLEIDKYFVTIKTFQANNIGSYDS